MRFLPAAARQPDSVAGVLFIPPLTHLLGLAGGTERPSHVLLLIWWHLGRVNGSAVVDVTGTTDAALGQNIPWHYIAASPLLFGLVLLGRRHQRQAAS